MFRFSLLTTLLLAAPALAYTITSPGLDANWTSTGPNTLTWQRVSTDASTFAVILVNDNRTVLPVNNLVVANSVDGASASTISISPPSGQFPLGSGFRINLVKNATDTTAILAQSNGFTIVQGTAVASSNVASGSSSATGAPNPAQTGGVSVHLPSFLGALITASVVTLVTA